MDGMVHPATASVPAAAPLAMPAATLRGRVARTPLRARPRPALAARIFVLGGAAALTLLAGREMWAVLGLAQATVSGVLVVGLFALLFFWVALAFTSALAGVPGLLRRGMEPAPRAPLTRTALLLPIYNEDPDGIARIIRALRASLAATGHAAAFDMFVLSDTRGADRVLAEDAMLRAARPGPGPRLYWRNRHENTGRKAGNIGEWVQRFGAAYEHFVILDADSVMHGETLLAMVAAMEDEPGLGLLQTLPLLRGGQTRFARAQAFAAHAYGRLIAHGLAAWHGDAGNYWGHNAIIRTAAFAAHCGLPELPGRRPWGGPIMSHDFVEAALLRRAGWAVRFDPGLGGSFEEGPPTLTDMAVRDRRWCQGNIQHAAVIGAPGLHPLSRLHMAQGIMGYASAPLWLGFLLLGLAAALEASRILPDYFPAQHTLFPVWPVYDAERAMLLFGATMLLLLAPKLLGLALSGGWRRGLGEIALSALLSPVTMLTQTRQCIAVLRGQDSGWEAQRRAAGEELWRDHWRSYRRHALAGALLLGAALLVSVAMAAWLAPVVAGLLLAPWLSWWTAQPVAAQPDPGLA